MFILAWTTSRQVGGETTYRDHWVTFEDLERAKASLNVLVDADDTWVASVCSVIDSTDYAPE
jgi:hypothetical protein